MTDLDLTEKTFPHHRNWPIKIEYYNADKALFLKQQRGKRANKSFLQYTDNQAFAKSSKQLHSYLGLSCPAKQSVLLAQRHLFASWYDCFDQRKPIVWPHNCYPLMPSCHKKHDITAILQQFHPSFSAFSHPFFSISRIINVQIFYRNMRKWPTWRWAMTFIIRNKKNRGCIKKWHILRYIVVLTLLAAR